jgi:hypothetical protein
MKDVHRQLIVFSGPMRTAKHPPKPLSTGLFCFLPSKVVPSLAQATSLPAAIED